MDNGEYAASVRPLLGNPSGAAHKRAIDATPIGDAGSFKCSECGEGFKTNSELQAHLKKAASATSAMEAPRGHGVTFELSKELSKRAVRAGALGTLKARKDE